MVPLLMSVAAAASGITNARQQQLWISSTGTPSTRAKLLLDAMTQDEKVGRARWRAVWCLARANTG